VSFYGLNRRPTSKPDPLAKHEPSSVGGDSAQGCFDVAGLHLYVFVIEQPGAWKDTKDVLSSCKPQMLRSFQARLSIAIEARKE